MIQALTNHIAQTTHLTTDEARWLLEFIFDQPYVHLLTLARLPEKQIVALNRILNKIRKTHQPLAYVLKQVPFLNQTIYIKPPILIPRQETEQWVYEITQQSWMQHIRSILDIGTGSGCIALTLAAHFKNAQVTGIDINPTAIRLAKKNATINKINNVQFLQSNLFAKIKNKKFDLIVSNPPYIDPAKINTLNKQVIDWEDKHALFAENQGLAIIEQILKQADQFLTMQNQHPQLIIEIDSDQNIAIEKLAAQYHWQCTIQKDLFGKWRTVWCKKKNAEK